MDLNNMKNDIWGSLDLLRGNIPPSDFIIVLFLLTADHEGCFNEIHHSHYSPHDIKDKIRTSIYKSNSNNSKDFQDLLHFFMTILDKISGETLIELLRVCVRINSDLTCPFGEIFDFIFERLSNYSYGSFNQVYPQEVFKLIWNLGQPQFDSNIYNPYSDFGSLGGYVNDKQRYLGQFQIHTAWIISKLRMIAYKTTLNSNFILGNPVESWNSSNDKFDIVYSTPPIGLKMSPMHQNQGFFSYEQFIIENGVKDLKADGKLVIALSQSFLFQSGKHGSFRKQLIQNELIDTVIQLPKGLLPFRSIPFSVLLINKAKKHKGFIKLVDASKFLVQTPKYDKILDHERLISALNSNAESESIKMVSNKIIEGFDYSLNVPIYFQNTYEGVALGDILEVIKPDHKTNLERGKLVATGDLKEGTFDLRLNFQNLREVVVDRKTMTQIDESCLLINTANYKLKPTYFEYSGEPIFISTTVKVLSLRIREEIVDVEYLLHELNTDYILEQVKVYSTGSVTPIINKKDLLKIVIKLPDAHFQGRISDSIAEQKAKVLGIKEAYFKVQEDHLRLRKELSGLKEDTFREFASMKHTLRQYLNALKSNVAGTRKFIGKHIGEPFSFDVMYSHSQYRKQTFGEHLQSLEETVDSMSRLLVTDERNNSADTAITIRLDELVINAQGALKQEEKFVFTELQVITDSFSDESTKILPTVRINKDDFYILFSNIVSNAIVHGFKGSTKKNFITTVLNYDEDRNMCILEVSNNGIPPSEQLTEVHLKTRGEKSSDSDGLGIGGAEIKRIVDLYGGTFNFEVNREYEFPVKYIIRLPQINS